VKKEIKKGEILIYQTPDKKIKIDVNKVISTKQVIINKAIIK